MIPTKNMGSLKMVKPRRIDVGERSVDGWMLKSFIWEDSETGQLLGYNHHFQRSTSSDFMEFIRLDLHKKGDLSEDSPHVHIRLEARETPGVDDSLKTFKGLLQLVPDIVEMVR
jgi:hypothetical protein